MANLRGQAGGAAQVAFAVRAVKGEALESAEAISVDVYDVIGDPWGDGVSARDVLGQLRAAKTARTINVRINSMGGFVDDALAIYNLLHQNERRVIVDIDGIAASAATIVAMAGDEIRMAENSLMMIHNPWTIAAGDAADMRAKADELDKTKEALLATYAARTGRTRDELSKMLDDETWMTAEEAFALGFATAVTPAKQIAAMLRSDVDFARLATQLKAVPHKKYPLKEEGAWDGDGAVSRMRAACKMDDSFDWARYEKGFAWVDSDNRETFGAYKLPHHDVSGDSLVTVRAGVIAAGNAVQGSRGGVDIPAADMPGVKRHLAAHYREFGMTPPWESEDSNDSTQRNVTNATPAMPAPAKQPKDEDTMSNLHPSIAQALGLPVGAPESDVIAACARLRELEVQVVACTGCASSAEAGGALRGIKAKADESDKLRKENAELKGERDKQNFETQIQRGKAERKLNDPLVAMYREEFERASAEGNGANVVARVKGHVDVGPTLIAEPLRQPAPSGSGTTPLAWNGKKFSELRPIEMHQLWQENAELYQLMKRDHEASNPF